MGQLNDEVIRPVLIPGLSMFLIKLRRKSREGDYIDLKLLLPHRRGEKPTKSLAINDGVFEEVEGFHRLHMSIYLEFYP